MDDLRRKQHVHMTDCPTSRVTSSMPVQLQASQCTDDVVTYSMHASAIADIPNAEARSMIFLRCVRAVRRVVINCNGLCRISLYNFLALHIE